MKIQFWMVSQLEMADKGGAIYCLNSSPVIKNCRILENRANGESYPQGTTEICYSYGGGIYLESSSAQIINCVISNNSASSSSASSNSAQAYAYGGGIFCDADSIPIMVKCTISDNNVRATASAQFGNGWAESYGGGICILSSSSISLSETILSGNRSRVFGNFDIESLGGGIYSKGLSLILKNCIIDTNEADCISCDVADYTDIKGGGIYSESSSLAIENSLITRNIVDPFMSPIGRGGGIYSSGSNTTIKNCTIANNKASNVGGIQTPNGTTIYNSILWDNIPNEVNGDPVIYYSNVKGGWPDLGNIDENPLFVDVDNGDFHLNDDSPCINSGTSNNAPDADLDGNPRPIGDGYDMGAYEYLIPILSVSQDYINVEKKLGQSAYTYLIPVMVRWHGRRYPTIPG